MKRNTFISPSYSSPEKKPSRRLSAVLAGCVLALVLVGCKGGGDEAAAEGEDSGEQSAAAPAAPAEPPPVNSVKLVKKWPAGQTVTFSKNVLINRQVLGPKPAAMSQERETTYSLSFAGGAGGGGMDAGGAPAAASATGGSLAQSADMRIVGQKIENKSGGKAFISFTGSAAGGGGGGGEMLDDPDGAGGGGSPPPHPLANSVKASLGSAVKLAFDTTGAVTNVGGLAGPQGVQAKVFKGVPRGLYPLVGGMFSQTVFQEAVMFHSLLSGAEIKKDATWNHSEKGMLLLNWQQDFDFTNTFTGMEDWQGKKVAAFRIIGGVSGKTTKPMRVAIQPGAQFTGKALYSPDLGILVERTINGSFVATEGANTTVSNAFTQTFKVSTIAAGGDDPGMQ